MTVIGTFLKSPNSTRDFPIDWEPYLKPGETIASASYAVSGGGLTVGSGAYAATIDDDGKGVVVWLQGGSPGVQYEVTCQITTDNVPPRIDDRTILINVEGPIVEHEWSLLTPFGFGAKANLIDDDQPAIQAAIDACNPGGEVFLPPIAFRLNSALELKPGVTLRGPERGMRGGFRVYDVGYTQVGATLWAYDSTESLITMRQQSTVASVEIYYPNQITTGAPTPYEWTFDINANDHGCTVRDISCVNPYKLLRCRANGTLIENIWAFPFFQGMQFGRCADVTRVHNVHFAGNTNFANTAALFDWVRGNGFAFEVDGAEEINFTDCFAIGYLRGLRFLDVDGDGFRGVYGSWKGGGFDQCQTCVRLDNTQMLTARGFKFSDMSFVPYGDGTGVGVQFGDDFTPSSADQIPIVFMSNVSFSGFEHDTSVWMLPDSHGYCIISGGSMQQFANQGSINQSPDAAIYQDMIAMPNGVTRVVNSGGGILEDNHPIELPL